MNMTKGIVEFPDMMTMFAMTRKQNQDTSLDKVGTMEFPQRGQCAVFDSLPLAMIPSAEKIINTFYPRHHRYKKRMKHRKRKR